MRLIAGILAILLATAALAQNTLIFSLRGSRILVADVTTPTVLSAAVASNGTTLTVTANEQLAGNAGFTITPSGGAATLEFSGSLPATELTFTISRQILDDETITLAHSAVDVDDLSGRHMAAFSGFSVTNNSEQSGDSTAPEITTAAIPEAGTTILANFTEAVSGTVASGWTISASGGAVTVSSGSGGGTAQLTLTLSRTIEAGETVTISYSSGTGNLADAATNELATFSDEPVSNNAGESDFSDSFEGSGTSDWDDFWAATGSAGTATSGCQTGAFISPPTGGGSRVLRQWWRSDVDSGWAPEWLQYHFDTPLDHGDTVEIEFNIYYDPSFVFHGGGSTIKMIIFHTEGGALYWNSHDGGQMGIAPTGVSGWDWLHANANGGEYEIPVGEWVNLRYEMQVALQGQAQNGHIHVYVNDTLRFNHNNIHTNGTGEEIEYFDLNATFNSQILGNNQKRYWDLMSVTVDQ